MVSAKRILRLLPLLLLPAQSVLAEPRQSAKAACSAIQKAIPGRLWLPGQPAYKKENKDYYNAGLKELGPACISLPTSAQDVSTIVKILGQYSDVQFAVKSGGHSPNSGHSSVKDGVLIALRHINGTVLDKQNKVAYVKPGGHWADVMRALNGTGQTVVGGRLGMYIHHEFMGVLP